MNLEFKLRLLRAIQKEIEKSPENSWDGYVHPELAGQMTDAATTVFDSAMRSQEFYKTEAGI